MKSLNIFGDIKVDVKDGDTASTKIIDIEITKNQLGKWLGAPMDLRWTIGFGKPENTLGKNIKLSTNIRTSEDTIKGSFAVTNPNFNNSNKALITSIENTSIDKMEDNGYETNKAGFSIELFMNNMRIHFLSIFKNSSRRSYNKL